jgi:hypothetical protein
MHSVAPGVEIEDDGLRLLKRRGRFVARHIEQLVVPEGVKALH